MRHWQSYRHGELGDFSGPLTLWVDSLTRCPALFLLLGLAIPGTLGFLGLEAAGFAPHVDLDFAGYLAVDLPAQFIQNAVEELRGPGASAFVC